MNIVVLGGGYSPERHVSLTSAAMVTEALRSCGHQVALVDLYFNVTESFEVLSSQEVPAHYKQVNMSIPDLEALKQEKGETSIHAVGKGIIELCHQGDLTYLALHGACGEDGRLQALLELEGIRFTGSDYLSSAIAMDKDLTKKLIAPLIPTAPWKKVRVTTDNIQTLLENTSLPVVVKPLNSGSSIGVSIAKDTQTLHKALQDCIALGGDTLLEELIEGREIQVAILGECALPPIEIIVQDGFYDLANKYTPNMAKEVCPAEISPDITKLLSQYALTAFHTLGLSVLARADFILTPEGVPYFLEINTLPGMTPTSLVPQEAAAIGMDYATLCQTIVDKSLKKEV